MRVGIGGNIGELNCWEPKSSFIRFVMMPYPHGALVFKPLNAIFAEIPLFHRILLSSILTFDMPVQRNEEILPALVKGVGKLGMSPQTSPHP